MLSYLIFNLYLQAFEKRVNEIEKEIIGNEQVLYDLVCTKS